MKYDSPDLIANQTAQLPTFASLDEEAAFWDTHDSTEFEDQFEDAPDVRFLPAGSLSAEITIPIDPATRGALHDRARAGGTAPEALARRWIMERLAAR